MNVTLTGWALLIDTDKKRLKATGQVLLTCGMRVSYAPSVQAALSFLKDHQPGIILFHAGLEEPFSLLESVRADRRLDGIPLLLLTSGNEDEGLLESFFDSGVADLVQLPPPIPFVLCNRVRMLLEAGCRTPSASALPGAAAMPDAGQSVPPAGTAAPAGDAAPAFPQIEGVSFEDAVKNCGGEDVLKTVMQKFYDSVEERAGALEGFVAAGDWKNYRIAVHSLKSSARLIGAMQLSQDAKALEAAADALRTEEIISKNPALLDLYRSYRQRLLPVVEHPDDGAAGEDDGRPLLSEKDLVSACRDLRECLEISDFDSADYIMGSLAEYRVAEDRREFISSLKKAVADVNKRKALELLSGIKNK